MSKLLQEIRLQPKHQRNQGLYMYRGSNQCIYMYQGYMNAIWEPNVVQRAYAFRSLVVDSPKKVYQNDRILGSIAGMFDRSFTETEYEDATFFLNNLGMRGFRQNIDHFTPDYSALLNKGIVGLREDIKDSKKKHADDQQKTDFLRATEISLQAFSDMLEGYKVQALSLVGTDGYNDEELKAMAQTIEALQNGAPTTFRQALQLVWAWHVAYCLEGRYAMALGRMDQYLYPFYKADLACGAITKEEALSLLEATFIKIGERRYFLDKDDTVNICIAGVDENGDDASNELSYLIIEAIKNCGIPGPNLSARISQKTPDSLLDAALVSIGTGIGYPALMNDEVNMASLLRHGYDLQDVRNYTMVGCIENFLTGQQPPWSDGFENYSLNMPKLIEHIMYNGGAHYTNRAGVQTGDASEIDSMEEFLRRLEIQMMDRMKKMYLVHRNFNDMLNPVNFQQPFLSILCQNCIERGLDINMGGTKYPANHGFGCAGFATAVDSLAAIETVVFKEKKATMAQIRDAMNANFVGFEDLHQLLLDAPKYGNNNDDVDKYAVWLSNKVPDVFDGLHTPGGGNFFCGMASNVGNIWAGGDCGATPDGRKAREPYSDAASPTFGKDTRGATETVNSIVKPNYVKMSVGSVVNQKFSPSMFTEPEKRKKLLALIRVYFEGGGQEMQINATSREILIDAMNHPENYPNLVVRVSGFSAYYVLLGKQIQQDILNRTQQR